MNRVVCIQADANRFHVNCAKKIYGSGVIVSVIAIQRIHSPYDIVHKHLDKVPLDNEGNPIWAIFEDDWKEEKAAAKAHGETIYNSCGYCLGRIR